MKKKPYVGEIYVDHDDGWSNFVFFSCLHDLYVAGKVIWNGWC